MFEIQKCKLPGVNILIPIVREDPRGIFVKTFHADFFSAHGLAVDFREFYYSVSIKGVIRGLHFQSPPADHEKLVTCVSGKILDVVVDLRIGSPFYGHHETIDLSAANAECLYLPKGVAHGFYVYSESATMLYYVTTPYDPKLDSGIRWNSLGIPWPEASPIISDRDQSLIPFQDFVSPFHFALAE
jgi:dTDP-4-dehydrorhamnose 3,5-epimerase